MCESKLSLYICVKKSDKGGNVKQICMDFKLLLKIHMHISQSNLSQVHY